MNALLKQLLTLLLPFLLSLFGIGTAGLAVNYSATGSQFTDAPVLVNGTLGTGSLALGGWLLYCLRDRLKDYKPLSSDAMSRIQFWQKVVAAINANPKLLEELRRQYGIAELPTGVEDLAALDGVLTVIRKRMAATP